MVAVRWTDQALNDVEDIAVYISTDSVYYARLFTQKTFSVVKRLGDFPKSGRVVPEINMDNVREIVLGNYRIIYRLKDDLVEILTIYHSSRLLNADGIL